MKNKITTIAKQIIIKLSTPNSALSQVSFVAGGTVIAQGLSVFILPIVSRIYSPEDYGLVAVYSSVIGILSELSGLRYHLAIPLPKQKSYADALVFLSLIIQIVFVGIVSILLFISGDYIFDRISMEALIPYKYLIPIGLLLVGFYNIFTQLSIRESLFSTIGKTKISQCISGALAKIGLGMLGFKPLGLLIGGIIAQTAGITTLGSAIVKKSGIPIFNKENVRRVALRYRKFPMYSALFGILNTLGINMPQLFLSSFFSIQVTGLYSMAIALLQVPSVFIGRALAQVFLQRASSARHSGNLKQIVLKFYLILLKLGFFPIIFISLFAPTIFTVILGERWMDAGKYALLLSPWIAVAFVFSPMSVLYGVQERLETGLITEIIYFALRLGSMYVGLISGSPYIAVGLFSLSGTFFLFYRIIEILISLGNPLYEVILKTVKIIMIALSLALSPYWLLLIGANHIIVIFLCILVIIIYFYDIYLTFKKNNIL